MRYVVSIRYEGHGVEYHPNVTETCPELGEGMDIRNRETRQVLSQVMLEQAIRSQALTE